MDIIGQFKREVGMMRKFPFTVVVLAVLIGVLEYNFVFKEWLSRKDDVIRDKDGVISALEAKLKPGNPTSAPTTPATTGAATANGPGGVANTGSGNTFNSPRK